MDLDAIKSQIQGKEAKTDITDIEKKFKQEKQSEEEMSELKKAVLGKQEVQLRAPVESPMQKFLLGFYEAMTPITKPVARTLYKMSTSKQLDRYLMGAGIRMSVGQYVALTASGSILLGLISGVLTFLFAALLKQGVKSIVFGGAGLFGGMLLGMVIILNRPKSIAKKRANEIGKMIPFALREMATLVKAGISLNRVFEIIANGDYGALSDDFKMTVNDMRRGASTIDALKNMAYRTQSDAMKKVVANMIRAIKTGGNLSDLLTQIAQDVSFEMKMSIRDFVEKLNLVGTFYVVMGTVFPMLFSIMIAISKAQLPVFQTNIPMPVIYFVYFIIIPFFLYLFIFFIRMIEPKV